ncbi:hypothetical protein [Lysinibacillus xylanilyticus]|uniref:Uncharacterized protein n=1 Tax=Lysinibacillus xylanilyticus TaxID=582475 RepID=A0ABV3W5G8_9BACI
MGYIALEKYNSFQPKTSIDLVRKLDNTNLENYNKYSIDLTEDNYKDIKEFVSKLDQTISQFTVIESGEDILILETTPQTVDNRLKIKSVKKMSKEDFEKIFKE